MTRIRIRGAALLACIVTALLVILLTGCESFDFNRVKPSENLDIGEETELAKTTIPSSGGTVVVNAPGSEIDGMQILVPDSSYSSSVTFTVSAAPILDHDLGEYFNPLSPLIQIDNGGDYADEIMEVTIPVEIPEGHIPLGFYYDEITGTLEGIPTKEITENSITLLTRHFMPARDLSLSDNDLKAGGIKIDASSNLVISSIKESVLSMSAVISTGFQVGVDDWEFVNYGSYIAPGGHCAGQNFGALWYYYEKKLKGENGLFGNFSSVQSLWQDNATGYRFSSVIQKDLQWDGKVKSFCRKYVDKNQELDKLKLFTIAGVILTTGEPQAIGIYRLTGGTYADGTPKYGGHSVICTGVAINEGRLYISDPNKPGIQQFIEFKNDKFEPYVAQLNGQAASNPYPFITLNAKSSLIEWDQIGKRYLEMQDSTIGTKAPNTFPEYTIWVHDDNIEALKDNYITKGDTLRCTIECPAAERYWEKDGKKLLDCFIYDAEGNYAGTWETKTKSAYTILKPGHNRIGIYVAGERQGVVDKNGKHYNLFIDFKWFNIYKTSLWIDPNPIVDEPDKEIEITARPDGSAPANAKYVWNFGDGTDEVTVENDSVVSHVFEKEGDYEVSVKLYDNSNNTLMGLATAEANIAEGILSRLQKYKYVDVLFSADMICNTDFCLIGGLGIDNIPAWGMTKEDPIEWDGTSFSTTYNYTWETIDGEEIHSTGTINGTMSANGLVMKTLNAHKHSVHKNSGDVFDETIILTTVPYMPDYQYDEYSPRFGGTGRTISKYIVSFNIKWDLVNSEGETFTQESNSANFTDDEMETYLSVTFSEER